MIAAVVSLGLGLYEDLSVNKKEIDPETGNAVEKPRVKWIEGFAILVTVFIVAMVDALTGWQKERQYMKLNAKKDDRLVQVIRDGRQQKISVYDLVVGDVLCLEPGKVIAGDGVLIESHRLRCDESSITGESDAVSKEKLEDCESTHKHSKSDPFLLSGSKVMEGVGKCIMIAVGQHSIHGRTMMSMQAETQDTPLQIKLNKLANVIAKVGSSVAFFMFVALLVSYFIQFAKGNVDKSTPMVIESLVRVSYIYFLILIDSDYNCNGNCNSNSGRSSFSCDIDVGICNNQNA
jgi:Ca2+-transporting ATPase